ncbi:hemoblobin-interacting domain-containing protein, partial [Clostridium beijerinckii]|uniref:hemoblobin-interacting domain-containing protein n=1 Tax=Clostridium beijerinckii TaxID=1520 RepID=UPI0022E249B7
MKSKKLKQLISTVMIATTIATTVPTTINTTVAFASTYSTQDEAEQAGFRVQSINNDAEYEIIGYTGSAGNVVIPSQINNKPVTSIGQEAFEGRDIHGEPTQSYYITSIIIPNTIKSIGIGAFAHCIYLTSISIPNSVTSIGHAAFADCGNLRSIEVPDSVTNIGPYAFAEISPYAIFYVASQSEAQLLWTSSRMNYGMRIIILDLMERTKSDTTATLDFFQPLTGASSVKIQQSTDGETWTDAATEALTEYSTTATVTGLIPNTSYKFRLLLNGDFPGAECNVITLNSSPTLEVDSTLNDTVNPIEITFADNIGWRQAITEVDVDGRRIDAQNYVISEGKITFNPGVLSAEPHYITVVATNYTDATVSQNVILAPSPTLEVDSTLNDTVNPIEITFTDDALWRQAITEVDVDGRRIDPQNYVISEGKITFNPGVLSAEP